MRRAALMGVALAALAVEASAQTTATEAEQIRGRQKIFMMEGVLERAVLSGIDTLRRQLSAVMPDDMLIMTGDSPQVRGFRLDGYGVFFDVAVPGVRPSMAWSLRLMNETAAMFARDLEQMRAQIQRSVADPRQREEMQRQLLRIQQQIAPTAQPPAERTTTAAFVGPAPSASASVAAQVLEPKSTVPAERTPSIDPGEAYTEAVKSALIEAMLENSGALIIAPDEWLTVAARDNAPNNRFVASDPSAVTTIVLRVRGRDIAAFQARQLTLEEARKRVEVLEL